MTAIVDYVRDLVSRVFPPPGGAADGAPGEQGGGGGNTRPVRRVAIVGAGVGGLATLHSFASPRVALASAEDEPIEATLFESEAGLAPNDGAGFLLNGGLAVLGRIDPAVQAAVYDAGYPTTGLSGRVTSEGGAFKEVFDASFRGVGESSPELELIKDDGRIMCSTLKRGACQEALYESLPAGAKEKVKFGKKVVDVFPAEDGDGAMCVFEDGSKEGPFDLVVGADGGQSYVREYVDEGKIQTGSGSGSKSSQYTGIRIRYCVRVDYNEVDGVDDGRIRTYFGDNLYIFCAVNGTGKGKKRCKAVYLVYKEHDPTSRPNPASVDEWRQVLRKQLKDSKAEVPEIVETVDNASIVFELSVRYRDPYAAYQREIEGSKGAYCVLVGDSAHQTPPFLGQGANNTIQDAFSLATRIREYNRQLASAPDGARAEDVSLGAALKAYEKVRSAGMGPLVDKARMLGHVYTGWGNAWGAAVRNALFWTVGKLVSVEAMLASAIKLHL